MKKHVLTISFLLLSYLALAQNEETIVTYPTSFSISQPLSNLFTADGEEVEPIEKIEVDQKSKRKAIEYIFQAEDGKQYQNDEATVQRNHGLKTLSAPIKNWPGMNGGGCPIDPTGAAGTSHYIQSVNVTPFKIFNKSNGATIGTVQNIGSLWSPPVPNMGDPVIMYDRYADRWFISQFGSPRQVYIAISQTSDPTGAYYTYNFTMPAFTDYLKFSIWADGYYMTSNGTNFVNVFERNAMLNGSPNARVLTKNISSPAPGFWCPLPGDADGSLPPLGTPCPLVYYTDNGWGGSYQDAVKIHNMTTNWSNSSASLSVSSAVTLPTAAFNSSYSSSWTDVTQAIGTQKLDAIGGAIMYRSQWRKWVGYNTLLMCWAVKMGTGVYATKWVELRQNQSNNQWSLYQEGIYAPDNLSRWVASIAMDDNGSIGMSYLCTGKTPVSTPPSLRYTGRLKNDPLGQMTFAEQTAAAGSGASDCGIRVGDYSHTALDPDGLTFWHTGHYFKNGTKSRIYSYRITSTLPNESFENQTLLNVYQNGDFLNIKTENLPNLNEMVIDLFDVTGKLVLNKKINPIAPSIETSFNIAHLSRGIYMVRIGNKDYQKVVKIILK